jgi:hypothetical protein
LGGSFDRRENGVGVARLKNRQWETKFARALRGRENVDMCSRPRPRISPSKSIFFTILRRGGQSAGSSKLIKASRCLCILLVPLSFFLTRVELSNGISAWMGESECCPEDRWEFSVNLLPHGMCYCGSCSKSLFDPSRRVSNGALRLCSHHFCRLSVELSEDWAFNFSTTSSRM